MHGARQEGMLVKKQKKALEIVDRVELKFNTSQGFLLDYNFECNFRSLMTFIAALCPPQPMTDPAG